MKSPNKAGKTWLALVTTLLIATGASQSWGAAANSKEEAGCHAALTKAIGKQTIAVTKAMAVCTNAVLAGAPGPCPDATATEAIVKAAAKSAKSVAKKCQSQCSLSGVSCIGSPFCPPNGQVLEQCTAGEKSKFFESTDMGFPGPYCEAILGGSLIDPEGMATCANGIASLISAELIENLYGDLIAPPSLAAAECLATLVKVTPAIASKSASTVAKCRTTQLTVDGSLLLPDDCAVSDAKTAEKIAAGVQKLEDAIAADCSDATLAELSLCGNGIAGTTNVDSAQGCLGDVLDEIAISVEDAEDRDYAVISIINGAYPSTSSARCGDNLANQRASQFLPNGEECDGTDDSECPGACLAAGDVFECTCSTTRRSRGFADGFTADLDNGWTGKSHNSKVTDEAGFVTDVSNCDCDLFDETDTATCVPGHSVDPVCDVFSEVQPRCGRRIGDGTSCDQVGNQNGAHLDLDCRSCDSFAVNAGDYCTGSARYCIGGANTGTRCNQDPDCTGGSCSGSGTCYNGPFVGNGCSGPQNCGICIGGTNAGGTCSLPANCPGGTCETHSCATSSCVGGTNQSESCMSNADCGGTMANGDPARCASTSDCTSQCFYQDAEGDFIATTPCAKQADCADGERCRGVCDATDVCVKMRNGAPLPLSANGTSVCLDSQFFTNISGTRNILTGAHAVNYDLRSVTILANELNARPCPVCGGFCAANDENFLDGERCQGTCSDPDLQCRFGANQGLTCVTNADCEGYLCTGLPCRFDEDCPAGTCSGTDSPECGGTDCRLDLACGGGPNNGQPCRIEAYTAFGTTSVDCPPDPAGNISGAGLAISWTPLTSGTVSLEQPAACDAFGYQNYDCNCVTGGGATRTQPNDCQPACTDPDPDYHGRSCSAFTTCVGGSNAGKACDEAADCQVCVGGSNAGKKCPLNSCPGGSCGTAGTCDGNPRVCGDSSTGVCSVKRCSGGSNNGVVCALHGQCPGGTCPDTPCTVGGAACLEGTCTPDNCVTGADCDGGATCDNACPAGLCTPLCVQRGICSGGDRDGGFCSLDDNCVGGGTCVPDDVEEGACAQGSFNHCDGPGWGFISCAPLQVNTMTGCGAGGNGIPGDSDDNIGAGYCRADIANCFINNGTATGGGDPTNTLSVATFCIPASTSGSVNTTAGLPGPGRIRQRALVVPNYTQLP